MTDTHEEKMKIMGTTGREYVIDNFSTDVIIPKIVNISFFALEVACHEEK